MCIYICVYIYVYIYIYIYINIMRGKKNATTFPHILGICILFCSASTY